MTSFIQFFVPFAFLFLLQMNGILPNLTSLDAEINVTFPFFTLSKHHKSTYKHQSDFKDD